MSNTMAHQAPVSPYDSASGGPVVTAERAAACLARLRRIGPRVHSMTNIVAQNFTANVLLAAGVQPSMTIATDEVAAFTARSGALLINIGTLDPLLREAIPVAIAAARESGKRFVFDPVLIDRSPPRLALAREIVAGGPAVLRANPTEFEALAGAPGDESAVAGFARAHGTVVAITGAIDLVTDGTRIVRVANGHPLMGRVTAVGCAGTALIAAFCAIEDDVLLATVAGLLALEIAGEIAAERAAGPGSFATALIDALYTLTPETLAARARLS